MTDLVVDIFRWVLLAGAVTALVCLWFVIIVAGKLQAGWRENDRRVSTNQGVPMIALDRRVAELRGWTWDYRNGWWDSPTTPGLVAGEDYSPSTDLFQAYQLWEEARPDGYYMNTVQSLLGVWTVGIRQGIVMGKTFEASSLADLPRAITQAWVEVMEGK